ncbi:translation initiation factor eIF-5A family protein [Perkinsela sp. CCAP 1560/4]|nr:translation initiation factor eIF-5A family protein [Perkinsela sp. CCAP 1560/4]KNH06686.1 translation initiation factor eIF-5A family protein [Perkinsela sp. CCAP 1560/4]|eukprot:KNH05062.1 translation initiation factor eIF-5A family protein [Perkinsela sp. CCAP 1560/4]
MSDGETFESADAGASLTYPVQAGSIKKGDVVILDGFPCKVVDMSTSKTGKHGHAKAHIIGLDIFDTRKHEEVCPSSHNMQGVVMKRQEYKVMDIEGDQLTLMMDDGSMKEDLDLPKDPELSEKIRSAHEENGEVTVAVITAMGTEAVTSFKDDSGRK